MHPKYAYSLNGEHFMGAYGARDEALSAAIEAAHRGEDSPQTVYVGRRVPGDPKASGHARAVLANMSARARGESGDSGSAYLTGLSKTQIENFDKSLELVIRGWLEANDLMPSFFRVEAIGQYSVPSPSSDNSGDKELEVHEIGAAGE